MVEQLVEAPADAARDAKRVNVLPGSHITPGDIDELRDIFEAFGLEPLFLPDLSGSLDGHMPDDFTPTTIGGISVEDIASMGRSAWTIAIGEQMRPAAQALEAKAGVPFRLFDRLTGLAPNDAFIAFLSKISGRAGPEQDPPPAEPASRRDARRAFLLRQQEDRHRRRAGSALQHLHLADRDGLHDRSGGHDHRSRRCSKKSRRTRC